MDLSLAIVGLVSFVGYKLNDKKAPRKVNEKRKTVSPHETPSGKNQYYSTFSKEVEAKEKNIADIQFEKSKDTVNTNIVPPLYNSYCKWDCEDKNNNGKLKTQKTKTILPSVKPLKQTDKKKQIMLGPMFKKTELEGISLTTSDTVSGGDKSIFHENFSNISKMTGKPIENYHNNMVPHFGSNVTQNTSVVNPSNVLERFTGIEDVPTVKREVPKMFKNRRENVYGTKPDLDLISKDRFIPSNLKTNLLPVPQIKVQPLPEEYVRPSYKSVDELRVKSKPKVSYKKPMIKGQYFVSKRGVQGKVSKNRPDTFYINNPDRYFTTTGDIKAQTIRENFDNLKYTPKADTSEVAPQINPAYDQSAAKGKPRLIKRRDMLQQDDAPDALGLFTVSDDPRRHTYKKDWVRNATHDIKGHDYIGRKGYVAYEQERETTNRMTMLPVSYTNKGVHQSSPTPAKTTHKEGNLFSYMGTAAAEVEKTKDYTGGYNSTREKQSITQVDYKGVPSRPNLGEYDTEQYKNVSNFGNREQVMDANGYAPGGQKENTPLGAQGVNMHLKDDTFRKSKYNYGANVNRVFQETSSIFNLGRFENQGNKSATETDFKDRIDPSLLNAHRKNPYTKSLRSF